MWLQDLWGRVSGLPAGWPTLGNTLTNPGVYLHKSDLCCMYAKEEGGSRMNPVVLK